ncbi:MAG: glycoside hydrolase family 127 protein [Flavobacterium sp.]|nr:glycoside hydrolase family 127 protein [Flavobacterium sp.]
MKLVHIKSIVFFLFIGCMIYSQEKNLSKVAEKYQLLPFGSFKPTGWIRRQVPNDLDGFLGNLEVFALDLINDPIYSTGRLHKKSKSPDSDNSKSTDAAAEEQYTWWNSETQSNWWDGYIRNVILLNDKKGIEKTRKYIDKIIANQDEDGYVGIYDINKSYNFETENSELWVKTTTLRGLLAFYNYSKDDQILNYVIKAINKVIVNYPINNSSPFTSGNEFNGVVAHGLIFTDVLDKMYQITSDKKYTDYALFLYNDFSKSYQSEKDGQLQNILEPSYMLQSHGVHTFEQLRPLIVAAFAQKNPELLKAIDVYVTKIEKVTTLSGEAIGDEWITSRTADASQTGYEYCSLHELMDSYSILFQKEGNVKTLEAIENIFFNAAQGSRNPDHSCIASLKTDNSYEMLRSKNGQTQSGRTQTGYKYSPVHKDVAVCCVPNAGRITHYFIEKSWLKENQNTLIATLLCPNILETTINNFPVKSNQETNFPFENKFNFEISNPKKANFVLKIRKVIWAKAIICNKNYCSDDGFIVFEEKLKNNENIELEFTAEIIIKQDANDEKYFT